MNHVYMNVKDLIGNTPILKLNNYEKKHKLVGSIYAKLELFNPTGSTKDRAAMQMLEDAMEKGIVNQETTIIEPTSGNTGIGLASLAAALGMKIKIVMPESMSEERRKLIQGYGAQLVLTPAKEGMKGSIAKAQELAKEIENSFIPSQFDNPSNPKAHYLTTGPEIYQQLDGNIDVLVAGVGTGGTISGIGKYLKEQNPNIEIVAVEPAESPVLSKGEAGAHKIQGIGAGFVPGALDTSIYDTIITVEGDQAIKTAKELVKEEGISVGISSGAALYAATILAKEEKYRGKNIVIIAPDGGDRYLSTALFTE